jgi:hypothetical protein
MQKKTLFSGLLLLPALAGCDEPSVFQPPAVDVGRPAGIIDGTVTYVGPAPCTRNGKILGAAVILAFDKNLLPPPEGLGATAASLDVVPGEVLFQGLRAQLPFAKDGSTICGDPGSPVTVSGTWSVGPFAAGTYQIRGFYDLDGNFDPAFSISNLPTKGDVGGGAIENAAAALQGAPPKYREIPLGVPDDTGVLKIPSTGYRVSGVAVSLGLSLPLQRPIFYSSAAVVDKDTALDPNNVVMASDFQLKTFDPIKPGPTEQSFIRMTFSAGLPSTQLPAYSNESESEISAGPPFNLPNKNPFLLYTRQDVNGDGKIDSNDHIPDSPPAAPVPSLFPVAAFVKLTDGARIGSQTSPTVLLQGLTLHNGLLGTATAPADLYDAAQSATIALRPAVVCIDTNDITKPGVLLASRQTDGGGKPIIQDEMSVLKNLEGLFHRPFSIKYGCLPQGQYSINLVYGSGQAWTVPNEAGVCAPSETAGDNGQTCGTRPRLASQDVVLTIGPPGDGAYCQANPTPAECLPAPTTNK